MSALTDLQELIHSMTMNEKHYFNILSRREGKAAAEKATADPIFLRLFNKIADSLQKDEAELREKLTQTEYGEQLAYQQTYLREQILRSLQHFRSSKNANIRIYNLLIEIQILSDNNLTIQAIKSLNRLRNW